MKRRHYTETEIERLIAQPDAVDLHLSECDSCRDRFTFLRRLRREYEATSHEPGDSRIDKLVARLSGRTIYHLHPCTIQPDMNSVGTRSGVVVLAAQDASRATGRYEPMGTFVEKDERILVRVIHDKQEHRYALYLMTEKPETGQSAHLIVSTHSGPVQETVTAEDGTAFLEDSPPINWNDAVIAVEPHWP
jgi:hypothetical protein